MKKFFKIDKRKILLVIIFFIFAFIINLIIYNGCYYEKDRCLHSGGIIETCPLPRSCDLEVNPFLFGPVALIALFLPGVYPFAPISIFIYRALIFIVSGLIYWYLISCIIFYAIDRIKYKNLKS